METQELQAREKREVTSPAEQTKAGVVFTPPVDIFETPSEITVLADMPGVNGTWFLNAYTTERRPGNPDKMPVEGEPCVGA